MSRNKRVIISTIASVVLVVVVTVLTIVFGIVSVPTFTTQASSPLPGLTGKVAYTKNTSEDSQSCLHVVDVATAVDKQVACISGNIAFAWLSDGRLVVGDTYTGADKATLSIFSSDGTKTADTLEVPSTIGAVPGTSYFSNDGDSDLKISYDKAQLKKGGTVLIKLSGPGDYSFSAAQRSPDAAGYVLQDSNARVILATADGKQLRLLVDEKSSDSSYAYGNSLSWFQTGHSENTITVDDIKTRGLYQTSSPLSAIGDY